MTGTELATLDITQFEDIAKLSGQNNFDSDSQSSLPWLSINRMGEDDNQNPMPVGTYTVDLNGSKVFAKKITFRPFLRGFQYRRFDPVKKETVAKTKIILSWSEEAFDNAGTIRCGKPKLKKNEPASKEQEEIIKSIRCYMILFGLVSLEGTNLKGEPVSVVDAPMGFRIRGLSYQAMDQVIMDLTKKKRPMVNTNITLSLKRGKTGDNVYYTVVPEVDYSANNVWRGEADMKIFNDFRAYIQVVNMAIYEEYKKAVGSKGNAAEAATVIEGKIAKSKSLADDFQDDDISDVGKDRSELLSAG